MDGSSDRCRNDADKLRRIMEAALTVFSRSGYQGATMQDVTSEAGVGKGTIYLYFPSKKDLLESVLLDVLSGYRDQIEEVVTSEDGSREKMRRLVVEVLEGADRRRRQFRFLLQSSWGMRGEFKRQALQIKQDMMQQLSQFVAEGVQEGSMRDVDATVVAHMISGTLDSLAAAKLWSDGEVSGMSPGGKTEEYLADAVVDCLWGGMALSADQDEEEPG